MRFQCQHCERMYERPGRVPVYCSPRCRREGLARVSLGLARNVEPGASPERLQVLAMEAVRTRREGGG